MNISIDTLGAAFPGVVPELAIEAAAEMSKPFNIGAMTLPEKPLYRAGSARTTKGFHDTVAACKQSPNINNNNQETSESVPAPKADALEFSDEEQTKDGAKDCKLCVFVIISRSSLLP